MVLNKKHLIEINRLHNSHIKFGIQIIKFEFSTLYYEGDFNLDMLFLIYTERWF